MKFREMTLDDRVSWGGSLMAALTGIALIAVVGSVSACRCWL